MDRIRIIAIGMAMGAAEIVPGVSGGSIAFITGIYERLLNAIRQFTPMLLLTLKNDGLKATWLKADMNFLLLLVSGMGAAILLLASGLNYLLDHEPIFIWSFFFSLVFCSIWLVTKQIGRGGFDIGVAMAVGLLFGYGVTSSVPLSVEPTPLNLFLGGSIAICAWILPGISGSFILLILGLYRSVIDAITSFDIVLLASFALGCGIGIVAFSHALSRLLGSYRAETIAVLTGVMAGSLGKLWPWRNTLSYQIRSDGSHSPLIEEPVLPWVYPDLTGMDADMGLSAIGFLIGMAAVLGLHLLSRQQA